MDNNYVLKGKRQLGSVVSHMYRFINEDAGLHDEGLRMLLGIYSTHIISSSQRPVVICDWKPLLTLDLE